MTDPISELHALGQSLWYDNIQRKLLQNGQMAEMIRQGTIRGVTSNPSIFNHAIAKSEDYDSALAPLAKKELSPQQIFEILAVEDIQSAADLFAGLYQKSGGADGYVSLEVSPYVAYDTHATCEEAQRLWNKVNRPNLMIKIPATVQGLPAITQSIGQGINVNVTLIFSQERYEQVMDAYFEGLELLAKSDKPLETVASVASFFVSRIDTKVDKSIRELIRGEGPGSSQAALLFGKVAVANAKIAYQKFKVTFESERFKTLQTKGARLQRPLWASTSTKNPGYSDVKYVEELIGPHTVNTVPPHTLEAFRDHGNAAPTLESDLEAANQVLVDLDRLGISLADATAELEDEGVQKFADAYTSLLHTIEEKRARLG